MKKSKLLSLLALLLIGFASYSQGLYLTGLLNDVNGNAVSNHTVTWWYSPNGPSLGGPTGNMTTDTAGMFADTVSGGGVFGQGFLLVGFTDCDSSLELDTFMISPAMGVLTVALTYCDTTSGSGGGGTNCNANFTTTPMATFFNFTFSAMFPQNGASYFWDFGDGTTATTTTGTATHSYNATGTFNVCLTISVPGCTDTFCSNVTVQGGGSGGAIISGTVLNGNQPCPSCTVYLIEYDTTGGGILTAIDTTQTTQGAYQFTNVPTGSYLVKASLNTTGTAVGSYLPTYYALGTPMLASGALLWSNADYATPNSGLLGYPINMIPGNFTGGPGFIGGFVSQGANKVAGPGDGIENVLILLFDDMDNPITYALTDETGYFKIEDIAYGSYKAHTEVTGIPTTPVSFTIDASNETVDNIDVIMNSNGINGSVGIEEFSDQTVTVYPNPLVDHLTINVDGNNGSYKVMDVFGKVLMQGQLNTSNQTIDCSILQQGIYFIELESKGIRSTAQIIKK